MKMPSSIYALSCAALLTLGACQEYICDRTEQESSELVLLSHINANDSINFVYFGVSNGLYISSPFDPEVRLFVNDQPVDSVSHYKYDPPTILEGDHQIVDIDWRGNYLTYRIHYRFAEGDRIRIEASCIVQELEYDEWHTPINQPSRPAEGERTTAWAEVMVNSTAASISVDTLTIKGPKDYDEESQMQYTISVSDPAQSKDYYRLEIADDFEYTYQTPIGDIKTDSVMNIVGDGWSYTTPYVYYTGTAHITERHSRFDAKDDLILNGGDVQGSVSTNDGSSTVEFFPTTENLYHVFPDGVFNGRTADLKVMMPKHKYDWTTLTQYVSRNTRCVIRHVTRVRLHQLTAETYRYFKILSVLRDEDYEDYGTMMEPITTPQNVSGGIGYVSASMATEAIIEYPVQNFVHDGYFPVYTW